jgi:hypothetical protein
MIELWIPKNGIIIACSVEMVMSCGFGLSTTPNEDLAFHSRVSRVAAELDSGSSRRQNLTRRA